MVSTVPAQGDGAKRPDARTARWATHRVATRLEFVEAAIRTFDKVGPNATLDDICGEVGVKKPKLYRFFEDKGDLYRAILKHLTDQIWERLAGQLNIIEDSANVLTRRIVGEYANIISEHPNVFHFLASGQYGSVTGDSEHPLEMARGNAERAAQLTQEVLSDAIADPAELEVTIYMIFGIAASSADWWIRTDRPANDAFTHAAFVEMLSRSILGVIRANLSPSIAFDADQPLHLAFGEGGD